MKKSVKNLIVTVLVMGILVFSGCIGGNEDGSGSGTVETTLETTAKATTTTTLEGVSGDGALGDILKLGTPKSYSIAYKITSYYTGVTSDISYTMYSRGEEMRLDLFDESSEEGVESRVYNLIDSAYFCMYAEGQWVCFGEDNQTGEERDTNTEAIDLDDILSQTEGSLIYTGDEMILGINAKCFRSDVGGVASKFCIHPEYQILMRVETVGIATGEEGYMLMEAQTIDLNAPEDAVFELPEGYMSMQDVMASLGDEGVPA